MITVQDSKNFIIIGGVTGVVGIIIILFFIALKQARRLVSRTTHIQEEFINQSNDTIENE